MSIEVLSFRGEAWLQVLLGFTYFLRVPQAMHATPSRHAKAPGPVQREADVSRGFSMPVGRWQFGASSRHALGEETFVFPLHDFITLAAPSLQCLAVDDGDQATRVADQARSL